MLPPKDVYSAIISNESGKEVTVSVTYTNGINNTEENLELVIPAGGKATAGRRSFERGSATFVIVISAVHVKGAHAKLQAPFPGVTSPVVDYKFTIKEESGEVQLQGSKE